jgi:hypothetical protein
MASTISITKSTGINNFEERSMPFWTPRAITMWVSRAKSMVQIIGRRGLVVKAVNFSALTAEDVNSAMAPETDVAKYSRVQPDTTK